MPVYAYKGMTAGGKSVSGYVDADSPRAARARLRQDGVFPTWLGEGADRTPPARLGAGSLRLALPRFRRVSSLDLALTTRQLATLLAAGVQLVEALGALAQQTDNPRLKTVLGEVRDAVNQGASLADAMTPSGVFSELYLSLVRAGEAGGALETVLVRLAEYLEGQERLRNRVISITLYPAVMLVFACVVVAALVTVVLPQISELLTSLNQELPWYTRMIMSSSEFVKTWWWALGAAGLGMALGFRALVRTEAGRARWDALRLRIPVLGRVARLLAISRFSRTLSTLLAGGIPIVRALEISRHVTGNRVLGDAIERAKESITEGASIARPLAQSGQFPPLVTHMIDVGERSGQLEAMLAKVADTYDEQVETAVTRLTSLLEPFLILLMVGIVMVIILATLVPLLQVTSSLN